jgi:hypothetical protein
LDIIFYLNPALKFLLNSVDFAYTVFGCLHAFKFLGRLGCWLTSQEHFELFEGDFLSLPLFLLGRGMEKTDLLPEINVLILF